MRTTVIIRAGDSTVAAEIEHHEDEWPLITKLVSAINKNSDQVTQPHLLLTNDGITMGLGKRTWPTPEQALRNAHACALDEAAAAIYNSAADPEQEFYDHGVSPWLTARADAIRAGCTPMTIDPRASTAVDTLTLSKESMEAVSETIQNTARQVDYLLPEYVAVAIAENLIASTWLRDRIRGNGPND